MATIKYRIRGTKSIANILIRIIDGSKIDFETKTNFVMNPLDWSESKQRPKNLKNPDYKKLDADLQELKTKLLNYYNNSNEPITLLWLKEFINPSLKAKIPLDLINYIDYYKEARKTDITELSKRKYNLIKAKMQRFESFRGKPILIKEINEDFKSEFVSYYKLQNYSENTMQRELKFLKSFCFHAKTKGVEVSNELDKLRVDGCKADFVYLTFEEISEIEKTKNLTESLENARDWLVISCYTAQRVSDFMRFTKNMIRKQDGKDLIEFTQVKTGSIMTLPLHSKVLEILDKRNGNFPYPISDQKYNDYIKTVCEKAGITQLVKGSKSVTQKIKKKDESGKTTEETQTRKVTGVYRKCDLVTSHIGRRSFATNFYGKIPTSLLISATGHSTEQMFLVYIGKSSSDKAMQLAEYF